MKKKVFLLSFLALFSLSACSKGYEPKTIDLSFESNPAVDQTITKGALGDFNLLTPEQNNIVTSLPTFTWEASANAISYTLEVCSIDSFDHSSSSVIYAKEQNIKSTSFKLSADLKTKNLTYYWRVTAVNQFNPNSMGKEKISVVNSFYYKATEVEEIPISVGEESDWTLHKDGSKAKVAIDHTDFFNTGEDDNLLVTFEKEDTNQGIPSSDGWTVVTKVLEQDFYGTDSLFFNFYYAGNDADVLIRAIDADGEYWYKNVQISQNAKQTVLIKFSEFTLRTKDTLVQNNVFNYEHLQYIEVVFEHAFGDGCCVVGNFRAVNFRNYSDLFIEKLNFNSIPQDKWVSEGYKFHKTVSEDGSELKLEYSSTAGTYPEDEKGVGSYGYGFAKIPLNCYLASGNAIKLKVKYTGYKSGVKALIRVYEEDTDRWSYEQPFSTFNEGEFIELTIPYTAFAKSEIRADGNRQFYYILQLQFGVSGVYGSGSITYKDVEIVSIPNVSTNPIEVKEDGVIDNFDNYSYRTQLYEHYETSSSNKDEGMFINTSDKLNVGNNINAGQFNYKSDMGLATYDSYLNVSYTDGNALRLWVKDGSSLKSGEPALSYLTSDDISPLIVIQLALKDGRWYRYTIEKAPRRWTEYVISFSDFELYSGVELETSEPFVSQNVVNFAFGMQYFYYLENGTPYPVYTESNQVFLDSISFTKSNETRITPLEKELHPDSNKVTAIDDFEYENQDSLNMYWYGLNHYDYENLSLSDEVSSVGGNHSLKLDYKGGSSPSYATYPAFGTDVQAKAVQFDMKGDGKATVYLNFYIRNGNSLLQYRHTFMNVSSSWNRYIIGFDSTLFKCITSTSASAININSMPYVQRITFGIVDSTSNEVSSIYIDNLSVTGNVKSFTVNTITAL